MGSERPGGEIDLVPRNVIIAKIRHIGEPAARVHSHGARNFIACQLSGSFQKRPVALSNEAGLHEGNTPKPN
jgi:hypothetical protein